MEDVDFFAPGARLALEQWRQAVRDMEASIDAMLKAREQQKENGDA
jgi:hypothetical protein